MDKVLHAPGIPGFFCIEGIEGGGKSTLIQKLNELLLRDGIKNLITREPGSSILGKKIREILLDPSLTSQNISPISELLLFFADRAQHIEEVIKPALKDNKLVLCDRFIYSTIAYQCHGRGLEQSLVSSLIELTVLPMLPIGVILLDLPVEIGLARAKNRASFDRFEKEEISFHERIRSGFLNLAKQDDRFLVLDAQKDPDELSILAYDFIKARHP